MRIIKTKTYEEMSAIAAGIIGGQVLLKPNCVLGLATGSSPIGAYKDLVKSYEDGILDFSEVRTVNLDEYCGLDDTNPNSYRYFMNDHLFDHVNIDKANTHVPNGHADDLEEEAWKTGMSSQQLRLLTEMCGFSWTLRSCGAGAFILHR